jgi:hypothetical protein
MSTLQDSLNGTDCEVALPSQEDTALHHTQSPKCSGSLLRGSLAITTTGLPPVSHQNLSRRTIWMLAGLARSSPFSTNAETPPQQSQQLLAKFCLVSDLVLRINPKPQDQPNHIWRVEPAKAVALLADRKVVLKAGLTTQLVGDDVISLPFHAHDGSADMTGSTSLLEHRCPFLRCQ